MEKKFREQFEAAAFRGLIKHLQTRTDVQNIDLMNLSGFCRNCLSKWYLAAAKESGIEISYEKAREVIYGMPYDDWKKNYQLKASEEQKKKYQDTKKMHARIDLEKN